MATLDAAYNFARFLSRDRVGAEQIVHTAFLRVRRGLDGDAHLLKIVRDCYRTWLMARRQKGQNNAVAKRTIPADALRSVLRSEDDEGANGSIKRAIESLPRRLREILVLREIEALPYREIAEVTSLPTGEVMVRLARARRLMAQSIGRGVRMSALPDNDGYRSGNVSAA